MANITLMLIGLILMGVGALYFLPMMGMDMLPFTLPSFGIIVMGIPGVGVGLLVVGLILLIVGIKSF